MYGFYLVVKSMNEEGGYIYLWKRGILPEYNHRECKSPARVVSVTIMMIESGLSAFTFFLACGRRYDLELVEWSDLRIKTYHAVGELGQIAGYTIVVDTLFIDSEQEFLHVVGHKEYKLVFLGAVGKLYGLLDRCLDIVAIVAIAHVPAGIGDCVGTLWITVGGRDLNGIVYVQLVVAHEGEMIPEGLFPVVLLLDLWLDSAH